VPAVQCGVSTPVPKALQPQITTATHPRLKDAHSAPVWLRQSCRKTMTMKRSWPHTTTISTNACIQAQSCSACVCSGMMQCMHAHPEASNRDTAHHPTSSILHAHAAKFPSLAEHGDCLGRVYIEHQKECSVLYLTHMVYRPRRPAALGCRLL
jgi:hypothetical protein